MDSSKFKELPHLRMCARSMVQDWRSRSEERKARMGHGETQNRQRSKVDRHLLYEPDDGEHTGNHQNFGENWNFRWIRLSFAKEGSMSETHSSGPPQETECRGLMPRPDSQNEVCMYRGTAQVYETTSCNLRFPEIMKTRLVHKFISMPQAMKIPDAKAAVDKEWKKVETILAWQLGKVKSKKDDFQEAQRDEKKVHFATLMDICHLKNAALAPLTP